MALVLLGRDVSKVGLVDCCKAPWSLGSHKVPMMFNIFMKSLKRFIWSFQLGCHGTQRSLSSSLLGGGPYPE